MTTDERRAYMREYMRAYRPTHRDHINRLDRANRKLRNMGTKEQITARNAVIALTEIYNHLYRNGSLGSVKAEWYIAIGYAIGLIEPLTAPPLGEGFGNLSPRKEGEK